MPQTDEVVRESLEGRIHWSAVSFALMPEYKDVIPIAEINAKIPVINVTTNEILCEVAKELKKKSWKQ